jgi:MipA family protein
MKYYRTVMLCIASCLTSAHLALAAGDETYAGLGTRSRPAYEGSDSSRADIIPYLRFYGEHLFARTTQGVLEGGWRAKPWGGWVFGMQLAYEDGRVSDESAFLKDRHFQDLDPGASIGLHVEADWKIGAMPVNTLLRYRQNLDTDQGAQADLRVTAGIFSRWGVEAGVFGQLTWADGKAMQSYFGVTPQQAVTTGLPAYSANAGLRHMQFGLLGAVNLSEHWLIPWAATIARLQQDAGRSPIAQDRTNLFINAGIAYRF